jgi:hypothetical protein
MRNNVAAFITKRTGSSVKEAGSFFVVGGYRGGSAGLGAYKPRVAMGGRLCTMLDVTFRELCL